MNRIAKDKARRTSLQKEHCIFAFGSSARADECIGKEKLN